MKGQKTLHSHQSDLWGTPRDFFELYHHEFAFTIDASADETNHLLPRWWGPGSSLATNALDVSWKGETCWLNPPYSNILDFTCKARYESLYRGVTTVMLIPSRTDTKYWHKYIWNTDTHTWHVGVSGRFVRGRLKFRKTDATMGALQPAPFPSVVIIFHGR